MEIADKNMEIADKNNDIIGPPCNPLFYLSCVGLTQNICDQAHVSLGEYYYNCQFLQECTALTICSPVGETI
jgi:hypothetical protein